MKNWSRRTRIFLGAMLFMIVLTVAGLALAVWKISEFLRQPMRSEKIAPLVIREPKTLIGDGLFSKAEVFKQSETTLGDIFYGSISEVNDAKREIAAASKVDKATFGYSDAHYDTKTGDLTLLGKFGVQTIDRDGKLKQEMLLEPEVTIIKIFGFEQRQYKNDFQNFKIIDLENDGKLEFLAWGGLGGISVFNNLGKKIFSRNKMEIDVSVIWDQEKMDAERQKHPSVNAAAAGDLDGDGIKEIIYTTSNDEMIAIDKTGKEIWKQTTDVPGDDLWTFDLEGDSRSKIVEVFFSKPVIRDANGNVEKEINKDSRSVAGVLVGEGENKKTLQFAGISDNQVYVFDESDRTILDGEAPLSEIPRERKAEIPQSTPIDLGNGTIVRPEAVSPEDDSDNAYGGKFARFNLKKGEANYLAAAASYWEYDRSILYVYSPDGKLVYHEILPEECRSIILVPNENGSDDLLIVGKDTVWRYNVNR
jgi:hypothetical protein